MTDVPELDVVAPATPRAAGAPPLAACDAGLPTPTGSGPDVTAR